MNDLLKILKGFQLIDGTGSAPVADALLVIDNDVIIDVGKAVEIHIPEGAEIIDLSGRTVIPGLIDAHVHLFLDPVADPLGLALQDSDSMATIRAVRNGAKTLRGGITTVRDMGWRSFANLDLRNAVEQGIVPGPRILACGQFLTMTGGHAWSCGLEVDGPDELCKGARQQLKAGADLIKLMATGGVLTPGVEPGSPQLNEEEMRAAIREAQKAGKQSAAHAQGTSGIKNAIRAGITSIEHGMILDEEAVEMMLERGVYLVPTLAAPYWINLKGLEAGIPEYAWSKNKNIMEKHKASFQMALRAGVKIAMGTDAGTPYNEHGQNHIELKLMVEQGMSTLQAITAATQNAADLLGIGERVGTLAKGKEADLLILNGDPLKDINAFTKIDRVYKGGKTI